MNIFEAMSLRIPCRICGHYYEVSLSNLLLSNHMLKQSCLVHAETECAPLFQTRLIDSEVLRELAIAWNRLENNVRRNDGELVIREVSGRVPLHKPPATGATSQGGGTEVNMRNEFDRLIYTRLFAADSNSDPAARERGLDETLKETFPCSDALSAIPDPPLREESA